MRSGHSPAASASRTASRPPPAEIKTLKPTDKNGWYEVTLFEGHNQQIRKMGEVTGFPVMRLARVAFAGISTERLRPGEYRALTREELAVLELVNGKNTIKDIIRKSRMGSFEVSKMLYRLLSIKLVRRRVLPVAV